MNREDIIRMANKAGFEPCRGDGWPDERLLSNIEKFASLVAEAEREACALIIQRAGLPSIATAIRARGRK
jgi:hypothetical protein